MSLHFSLSLSCLLIWMEAESSICIRVVLLDALVSPRCHSPCVLFFFIYWNWPQNIYCTQHLLSPSFSLLLTVWSSHAPQSLNRVWEKQETWGLKVRWPAQKNGKGFSLSLSADLTPWLGTWLSACLSWDVWTVVFGFIRLVFLLFAWRYIQHGMFVRPPEKCCR